jgi:hypothetical protein
MILFQLHRLFTVVLNEMGWRSWMINIIGKDLERSSHDLHAGDTPALAWMAWGESWTPLADRQYHQDTWRYLVQIRYLPNKSLEPYHCINLLDWWSKKQEDQKKLQCPQQNYYGLTVTAGHSLQPHDPMMCVTSIICQFMMGNLTHIWTHEHKTTDTWAHKIHTSCINFHSMI